MASDPILVPFRAEHMLRITNRDGRQFVGTLVDIERRSVAYTAIKDGRIIGCAGITLMWEGVATAWTVMGPDAHKYMFWATKMTRRFIRDTIKAYNLHRLEMVALADNDRNRRWAKFLGFQEESLARCYTSDQRDMIRYEWVKKDG